MARFRYKLQGVLNIKEKMEDQAKQEFSTAKMLLDQEEEKLEALKERQRAYEQKVRELLQGILDVREIEANKEAIVVLDSYIGAQELEVAKARRNVEDARDRMREAMQDRKTYETLREKAFDEFLKEENRAESKVIDELTSYTYGQKQGV